MSYESELKKHLAKYKQVCLEITEPGTHQGREYGHILPDKHKLQNLLEEARDYDQHFPDLKPHFGFHHLNSSQVFAINLFFPYFSRGGKCAAALLRAFGTGGELAEWELEAIPEPHEGTNIDARWKTSAGLLTLCEVKLSEADIGKAKDNTRHRNKFTNTYRERLTPHLEGGDIELTTFLRGYQFYRNVYHMVVDDTSELVFLLPRANAAVWERLHVLLQSVTPQTRNRIRRVAMEDVLNALVTDSDLPSDLRDYASRLIQKYVIS